MNERKLFSRREWPFFLLLAVLTAGALLLLRGRPPGTVAVVEVNGREAARQDLSRLTEGVVLPVAGENGVELTVEFTPGGARVLTSTCPDKTCQRTGLLTQDGESAVCLPGRVVLRLEGGPSAGADAETY